MNELATVFALISAAGIWIWLAWMYRDYRVDLFRERLFTIRDDLFDVARSGAVSFDNPAYGMLRMQINGFIRFGDRVSASWLLSLGIVVGDAKEDTKEVVREMDKRWTEGLNVLDKPTSDKLVVLQGRLHREFAKQVLFASPLLILLCFALVFPLVVLTVLAKQVQRWFSVTWQPQADAAAYSEGCFA